MSNFINDLENWQQIPRDVVLDSSISHQARFVYCYMACKPNDWDFIQGVLCEEIGMSEKTLQKYVNELIRKGWLEREEQRNGGKFSFVKYTLKAIRNVEITARQNLPHGKNCGTVKIPNNIISTIKHNSDLEKQERDSFSHADGVVLSSDACTELAKQKETLSPKKEKEYTLTYKARLVFDEYYASITNTYPYWSAKEMNNLKQLLDKLQFKRKNRPNGEAPLPIDDESMITAFGQFLRLIEDNWILEHLSVCNINSKFDELISQIYNKHQNNGQRISRTKQEQLLRQRENMQTYSRTVTNILGASKETVDDLSLD